MKFLKEKKIFGILSTIDMAIVAFIFLIAAPAIYYYVKFNDEGFIQQKALERFIEMKKRQDIVLGTGARAKQIDVDVSFKNLTSQTLAGIKKGDRYIDIDGTVMAEILWVGESVPNYFVVDIGTVSKNEFIRTVPDSRLYSLAAKVRLFGIVGTSNGTLTFKDKNVKELEMLNFKNKDYEAYFVIEGPLVSRT